MSLPALARIVSFPAAPSIVFAPVPPVISSAFAEPVIFSIETKVSAPPSPSFDAAFADISTTMPAAAAL